MSSPQGPLYLIGYRGSGKTATAQQLAQRLGWSWHDADAVLEQRFGRSIRQIFADEGETGFRDKETLILHELAAQPESIIATGGGVILRPENRELLRQGTVVWLTAPAEVLWQRLQGDATTTERRPDLAQGGLAEIESLLQVRQPLYEACADWHLDTEHLGPAEVADRIVAWLQERA